jgi:2-dehydro-3-deoxyphosphogluconate aldolase/(4S)-4-hydroxy-2-oxoglutarate aldolase
VTPSEIEAAMSLGLRVLKFFPAEASGGPAYLSAVRATYPTVRFMPTGGINMGNLASYLALQNVIATGGTWIATAEAIRNHRWAEIFALAAAARALATGAP